MAIRLLLDEMVEHEVLYRLRDSGLRAEHVHLHETLPDGVDDDTLAEYSLENEALIVTYDDDFEVYYTESEYWGVLLFSDDDWSAAEVARTVHRILGLYGDDALQRLNFVGREWI